MADDLDSLLGEIEEAMGGTSKMPAIKSSVSAAAPGRSSHLAGAPAYGASSTAYTNAAALHHAGSFSYGSSSAATTAPRSSFTPTQRQPPAASAATTTSSSRTDWLDDLLKDTDGVSETTKSLAVAAPPPSSAATAPDFKPSARPAGAGSARCTALHVGGVRDPEGQARATDKRACDNLRCLSCDFQVLKFRGSKWAADAEYMFFRNYMPDTSKLAVKLVRDPDSVAYCCQCSWTSETRLRALPLGGPLNWSCAGH